MLNTQMQCSGGMSCGRLVCLFLIPAAEHVADLHAQSGQQAGADADKRRRQPDVHAADHGKGNADGQRVYGSGHGHEKHGLDGQVGVLFRVVAGFVFLLQRFLQHVDADDDQQTEGNPVVERFNGFGKQRAKEKAGHGHQHLEAAEPEADGQIVLPLQLLRSSHTPEPTCRTVREPLSRPG